MKAWSDGLDRRRRGRIGCGSAEFVRPSLIDRRLNRKKAFQRIGEIHIALQQEAAHIPGKAPLYSRRRFPTHNTRGFACCRENQRW
jgi:hypothetical protein